MTKTVYFLGAGFTKEAGVPLQSGIIPYILNPQKAPFFRDDELREFRNLLEDTYGLDKQYHDKFTLEDLFTPLDRCINEGAPFRNLKISELSSKRELLYRLISRAIKVNLELDSEGSRQSEYLDVFTEHVFKRAKQRLESTDRKFDGVSIISTNWDITVDSRLYELVKNEGLSDSGLLPKSCVDYCCHVSSYNPQDNYVKPGLEVIGNGGFNIKLLKLHGSLNWLRCPRCHRTYVDFENKIATNYSFIDSPCRHCDKNYSNESLSNKLVSDMIMPTYIKDFNLTQYKMIWQNAAIEISEADELVFIGYSLPPADFEIRQLLLRMVRKNAKIVCVTGGDRPKDTLCNYSIFFGRRVIPFENGAENYILNNLNFEQ